MKFKFPVSKLTELKNGMRENPDATEVILTYAELADISSELIKLNDANAVIISQRADRKFHDGGHWINVRLLES